MAQVIDFPTGAERSAMVLQKEHMRMNREVIAKRLRQLRESTHLTQIELAQKARGVSARQISRLESGKCLPHRGTIKRLSEALGVDQEVLTGEKLPAPAINRQPNAGAREAAYPFYLRIHPAIRNAYELAAHRYRVSVPTIARLAPLLFVILAEASLSHRGTTADKWRTKIDELEKAASELPYGGIWADDDSLRWEEDSIENHDVFGGQLPNAGGDGWDSDNPFAIYLETLAARYGRDDVTIDAIGPTSADYRVCRSAALALAEGERELADSLLSGKVLIHKMWRGLTREQRIARMHDLEASVSEIEEIPEDVPEQLPEYHDPSDLSLAIDL